MRNSNFLLRLLTVAVLLASTAVFAEEESQRVPIADDWLELEDKFKIFLPGEWGYEATSESEGWLIEGLGAEGKVRLTIQTIEGKQTVTPEKLQGVFEQYIASNASTRSVAEEDGMVKGRYIAAVDGQQTLFKSVFARKSGTSYMLYLQALEEEAAGDAAIEKLMDSVLGSFEPL